jgi:hypothetical protein
MWGNALGWCISAVMVLGTAGGLAWLNHNMQTVSPRTAFSADSENGAAIELPVAPSTVLSAMADTTDAAALYRKAMAVYQSDPETYGRFSRSGQLRDIQDVPALQILMEATNHSAAALFIESPAEIVNYDPEKPAIEALRTLAICARRAGQLTKDANPTEAMKLYEATFSLGAKLYQERLTYQELDAGLTMMAEGSAMIRELAQAMGDSARAAACSAFDKARADYVNQRVLPVQRVIVSADQATLEQHAGDVYYFARHARDRMWRVEAILKLGRYRFNAGRIGDQSNAMLIIRELLNDPDPVIQQAAKVARDLTIEQYRMLR